MIVEILKVVSGMPRTTAIQALSAAITEIAGTSPAELAGPVEDKHRIVPAKKRPYDKFTPVWDYLKTVKEYTTGKALHADLVARFGKDNTPSQSNLYKYLKENGRKRKP